MVVAGPECPRLIRISASSSSFFHLVCSGRILSPSVAEKDEKEARDKEDKKKEVMTWKRKEKKRRRMSEWIKEGKKEGSKTRRLLY